MADEKRGIAFTSGINKDGWQISVTERADGSAEAYANLEATIALMADDGVIPFVSYYNRALDNTIPPTAPAEVQPTSVLDLAKDLGGVPTPVLNEYVLTDEGVEDILAGISEDGTNYLGVKAQKPKVAECKQGDSYEIYVDAYKRPEKEKIEFYNEHSQYPACSHSLKGAGGKLFQELFPGWEPAVGSGGKLKPMLLYIVGENETREGNAYQNLKGVKLG